MKATLVLILLLVGLFSLPKLTHAVEPTPPGCQPLFNGGDACSNSDILSINKKILKPTITVKPGQSFKDGDFVENIGPNDTRYGANAATAFRIYLTNKSRGTLKKIVVKDIFPPRFLTYVSGSGSYDTSARTFTTTIDELKANETKSITIQVMTARVEDLPTDNNSLCTINLALATVNNKTSQDTSQICVARTAQPSSLGVSTSSQPSARVAVTATPTPIRPQTTKGGLAVSSPVQVVQGQQTPQTGPEAIALFGLVPTGALGWLLRKKTS